VCTIAGPVTPCHDHRVSTVDGEPEATTVPSPVKRRNRWIWVSAALAVIAVGLLIWGLATRSDLDSTQQELASAQERLDSTNKELDSTQQELDSTKQDVEEMQAQGDDGTNTRAVLAAATALYKQFAEQLDATQDDLAATQKDLDEAQRAAAQAEKDAEAASQDAAAATSETEKATAEADQAKAEAKAAESKVVVATECAKAYVSAFGALFEGEGAEEQAPVVRAQLEGITADCKEQLAG
jgi:chromosome segregation ATPase